MSEANHQGINVEGNLTVGGDVHANNTVTHNEPTQPVTDDLRRRVEELLDALATAGLADRSPIAQAAIDLEAEVDGPTISTTRIEQILFMIERNAAQIAAIAAAIAATRVALNQ